MRLLLIRYVCAVIVLIVIEVTAETYYVTPTSSTQCPEEGVPCFTLLQYAIKPNNYFSSNTNLIMLRGTHSLLLELSIRNITYLNLTASTSAQISCIYTGRLQFHTIGKINFTNLLFSGCVNNSIMSVDEFILESCKLQSQGRYGTGLKLHRIPNVEIVQSLFFLFTAQEGGAITIDSCNVFMTSSVIKDNVAYKSAGGVYAIDTNITLQNCSFIENNVIINTTAREEPAFLKGGAVNAIYSNVAVNSSIFIGNTILLSTMGYENFYSVGGSLFASFSEITVFNSSFMANTAVNGGALAVANKSLAQISSSNFSNNVAYHGSAALLVYDSFSSVHNTTFVHNTGLEVVFISSSNLSTTGFLDIQYNNAIAVYSLDSMIWSSGRVSLVHNNGSCVLNIYSTDFYVTGKLDIHNNNEGTNAVIYGLSSRIYFSGYVSVTHNSDTSNIIDVIYIIFSHLSTTESLNVRSNEGTAVNGIASTIDFRGSVQLSHNHRGLVVESCNVTILGMADFSYSLCGLHSLHSDIIFVGDVHIMHNTEGGILMYNSKFDTYGNTTIYNNVASLSGGGMYAFQSELNFRGKSRVNGNKAGENGGGISAVESTVNIFEGVHHIKDNSAKRGGGMYLEQGSQLHLRKATLEYTLSNGTSNLEKWLRLEFTNNSADYGGAIYVNDTNSVVCQQVNTECFFQVTYEYDMNRCFPMSSQSNITNLHIQNTFLVNNTAKVAGKTLYGGLLDQCTLTRNSEIQCTENYLNVKNGLDALPHLTNIENITTEISSEPVQVHFCRKNGSKETYNATTIFVNKGETFRIPVVAIDQVGNAVPATIISSTEHGQLDRGQAHQNIQATCTDVEYRVFGSSLSDILCLYADGPCSNVGKCESSVNMHFGTCPFGFEESENGCVCDSCLPSHFVINCSIDTESVLRRDNVWIALENSSIQPEYIIYYSCPFDYCRAAIEDVYINLNSPDGSNVQCNFNRSGRLCGSCKDGLSLFLGSSGCELCSNKWIALLLIFALMGIVLVAFILTFKFSVAIGTISGLIFYANIIATDHAIFLPFDSPNFLTVFIAWLNLDFGFETCFYDGLDGYGKTWLQFVFPAYVLLLVFIVIVIANFSKNFAKFLSKRNPVAALATLILLSYTKFLRTVIAALSFATLEYRTADSNNCESRMVTVWRIDANIDYFEGKHVPLLIMTIVVILVGLVFTSLLLLWQWLQRCPNKRGLRWIRNAKLNAFMDAYLAPYDRKYRFWPGLLLLVRVSIYVIASTSDGRNSAVLLVVVCLTGSLLYLKESMTNRVYKNWLINVLESSFIFNLVIFATAILYTQTAGGNQKAVAYISTSIAFITFLAILIYHVIETCEPLKIFANKMKEQVNNQVLKMRKKIATSRTKPEEMIELQEIPKVNEELFELREPVLNDPLINSYLEDEKTNMAPKPMSPTHSEVEGIPKKRGNVTKTVV